MSEERREGPPGLRDATDRAADHAGIGRLADGLLPALIAKLSSSQLGELEVREGAWRVRLQRSGAPEPPSQRRSGDRGARGAPSHEGHAHPRPAAEGKRAGRDTGDPSTNGAGGLAAGSQRATPSRVVATSPAVGVFQPGSRAKPGTSIRAGDRIGVVDMLGVPQDVVSPVDGVVGSTLVESGTAVEYGQELVRIELAVGSEAS